MASFRVGESPSFGALVAAGLDGLGSERNGKEWSSYGKRGRYRLSSDRTDPVLMFRKVTESSSEDVDESRISCWKRPTAFQVKSDRNEIVGND